MTRRGRESGKGARHLTKIKRRRPIAEKIVKKMKKHVRAKVIDLQSVMVGRANAEALQKTVATRDYWTEFVFEAYVNHQTEAIFLAGLPDTPESRPHSKVNYR